MNGDVLTDIKVYTVKTLGGKKWVERKQKKSCKGEIDGNNSLARKRKSGEEGRKKWRVEEKVGALRSFRLELPKDGPGVYEEDWKRKLILLLFSGILFSDETSFPHVIFFV